MEYPKNFVTSKFLFGLLAVILIVGCGPFAKRVAYDFPSPVDTTTKEIETQEKKTFRFKENGISVSNEFDGARVNDCELDANGNIVITILPENAPINNSAYYGFQIWSEKNQTAKVFLKYPKYNHRYIPKLSKDRRNWMPLDSTFYSVNESKDLFEMNLNLTPEKLYVCGQELATSEDNKKWSEAKARHPHVYLENFATSKMGRKMIVLDICDGEKNGKDAVLIISRQHPPEISGYLAMQAFVDELLADNQLSNAFRKKYRTLVVPMVNPDGVDMGHWRHSAGGIDLNRDWAKYNQPEVNQTTEYFVDQTNKFKNDVLIGLDFHSTQKDVYYTLSDDLEHDLEGFKDFWIDGIKESFNGTYEPRDAPSGLRQPISKGWFFLQFKAEGITYEVGDETPRDFIKAKAEVAAKEMMKLLIFK